MTINIQKSCSEILNSVRNSNLNFSCQETPFSIYLTVRKSWNRKVCETGHHVSEPNSDLILSENLSLKAELADVKAQLKISKENLKLKWLQLSQKFVKYIKKPTRRH